MTRVSASQGVALLAHFVAILTIAGEVMQIAYAPNVAQTLLPWGLGILIFTVTTMTVGWLIALRRPRLALGWIVLGIAFLFGLQGETLALGDLLRHTAPGPALWLLSYGSPGSEWSWLPPIGLLFTQVPLRFPTGSLPSPRWRWFSWFTIAALALSSALNATSGRLITKGTPNPFYFDWGHATDLIGAGSLFILVPAFIGSIASLFVRHRHADAVQRTQLRWVFWAVAIVGGLLCLLWVEGFVFGDDTGQGFTGYVSLGLEVLTGICYSLIPLAILFAVLRYGLYSIDRIISRTATYAIVTVSVVVIYAAIVVLGSLLLPSLPSVGVAIATLVAAAVFLPLLRFVRSAVDRRFNRAQYDAAKVVERFGERIRTGADPHSAGADLLGAIDQTLQPATIGLWTLEDAR